MRGLNITALHRDVTTMRRTSSLRFKLLGRPGAAMMIVLELLNLNFEAIGSLFDGTALAASESG